MEKKLWIRIAMVFVIAGLMCTVSCRKKVEPPPPEPAPIIEDVSDADAERAAREAADAERMRLLEEERMASEAAKESFLNDVVYFEFDSSVIDSQGKSVLNAKAEWLSSNPGVSVIIEGHCDERGTAAYNLALGAKRADAVKKFMTDMGLDNLSIETQSYGEEKPADYNHNEEAWAKNRRACFVIN